MTLDEIANEYNKTKDPKLKKLWYKKVKEFANNGLNNSKLRMMEHMSLLVKVDCFDLCDIIRLKLTEYDDVLNRHVMKDGSGDLMGCICN